jgi:DNA-directed RNA polymerase sigma subunit (sigma70/sigma32)
MKSERNSHIRQKRAKGMTFRAIGREYGISPQRVQQICTSNTLHRFTINGRRQVRRAHARL